MHRTCVRLAAGRAATLPTPTAASAHPEHPITARVLNSFGRTAPSLSVVGIRTCPRADPNRKVLLPVKTRIDENPDPASTPGGPSRDPGSRRERLRVTWTKHPPAPPERSGNALGTERVMRAADSGTDAVTTPSPPPRARASANACLDPRAAGSPPLANSKLAMLRSGCRRAESIGPSDRRPSESAARHRPKMKGVVGLVDRWRVLLSARSRVATAGEVAAPLQTEQCVDGGGRLSQIVRPASAICTATTSRSS